MTSRWLFPPVLVLLACLSACDQNDVAAPFQVETGPLTLYGYLDATRTVQRARIEPRRRSIDFPRTAADALLNGTAVISYQLGENEDGSPPDTVRWTQRAERLPDGTYAAVFSAFFSPLPGERYRVVVQREEGEEGARTESAREIRIPEAGPPVEGAWYREDGHIIFPVTWPAELGARLDTLEVLHSGCLSYPPLQLSIPDTVGYEYVDTLLIGKDSVIVYGDTVVVAGDTIIVEPSPILSYIRYVPPRIFEIRGYAAPVEEADRGGFSVHVDLTDVRLHAGGLGSPNAIRYDRLLLRVRVRDEEWDGEGGDPTMPESGFLGGTNADQSYHFPPSEALSEAGLVAGGFGLRCG